MQNRNIFFALLICGLVLISGCITDENGNDQDLLPESNDDEVIILETSAIDDQTIQDLRSQLNSLREQSIDPDGKVALVRYYGVIGEEDVGTMRDLLYTLGMDQNYSAVILWIDSPGGGVGSTAAIYKEILKLRSKKPVIVFSSEIMASGAYYLACGADRIIADADCLVGNISTIYVHVDARQYYSDFGLKLTIIKTGEYKDIGADWRALTDEEYAWMKDMIYDAYNRFVHVVALGRSITNVEALELSDGKIWLAAGAKDVGLIDEVGDLEVAIDAAEELAGLYKAEVIYFELWEEGSVKTSGYHTSLRYQWEGSIDPRDFN